jgi:hypothetical protein
MLRARRCGSHLFRDEEFSSPHIVQHQITTATIHTLDTAQHIIPSVWCHSRSAAAGIVFVTIYFIYDQVSLSNNKTRIGGLVVKLAVAICKRSIRLAPGSIPGRCNEIRFFLPFLWCWGWW